MGFYPAGRKGGKKVREDLVDFKMLGPFLSCRKRGVGDMVDFKMPKWRGRREFGRLKNVFSHTFERSPLTGVNFASSPHFLAAVPHETSLYFPP